MFVKEKSLQSKSDTQEINVNAKTKQTKKKTFHFFQYSRNNLWKFDILTIQNFSLRKTVQNESIKKQLLLSVFRLAKNKLTSNKIP